MREILCAIELGEGDERAFAHALRLATALRGSLRLVHVEPTRRGRPDWSSYPHVRETLRAWGIEGAAQLEVHKAELQETDPLSGLLRQISAHEVDLVVVATHGREGVARWLQGSVCEELLRAVAVPVLALPPESGFVDPASGALVIERVLAPVCDPPGAQRALELLEELVEAVELPDADLRLLHVEGVEGRQPRIRAGRAGRLTREWLVLPAGPAPEAAILAEVERWRPDLVVMTTQGPQGLWERLQGSATEKILRGGHAPLLAVPAR